jgi:hypothetical protein
MPRCWPSFRSRSKEAGSSTKPGKLPDSGSSASRSTLENDSKAKTEPTEKEKTEDKKDEKKDGEKSDDKKDEKDTADKKDGDKKDDDKKDDDKKDGDDETKDAEEKDKPKVPVGSVSEAKNIYKGASDDDGNWTWVDKYPDDVEEAAENEETAKFAVVVRNQKSNDSRKKLEAHSIVVQSPQIRTALTEIMAGYPGVACELTRLEFESPFSPFVHRWYVSPSLDSGVDPQTDTNIPTGPSSQRTSRSRTSTRRPSRT